MPPLKKSEKMMLVGIGIMVIVFIIMDPYYFIYRTPPVEEVAAPPGKAAAPAAQAVVPPKGGAKGAVAGGNLAEAAPKRPRTEFAEWSRDPFMQVRRSADETSSINSLKLEGISVRGKDRYALINSQIMHPGNIIEGMTVVRIEKDFVLLTHGGRTYTLTWGD